ncbi:MAG TPA: hypothetical protein VFK06_07185 [Candidatus Angelobacter sp.]|nr:hypothetical protein [Candidatus Angelobacter sp.]
MMQEIQRLIHHPLATIIISLIGSGLVSTIVTGFFGLRAKRNEYVNDYYKEVIKRRIAAYEQLEQLIIWLKTAIPDKDGQVYHLLFAPDKEQGLNRIFVEVLFRIMSQGLWLSNEAFLKVKEFNVLVYPLQDAANMTEFGKKHYRQIAIIRDDLEKILARDMLKLYKVTRFLKSKDKPSQGFVRVNIGHMFKHDENTQTQASTKYL